MKLTEFWILDSKKILRKLSNYFQKVLRKLISDVPGRQTMLFSATQTKKIQELAKLSLNTTPIQVDITEQSSSSTVNTLEQVNNILLLTV
jgi:ATP-dependent RNA helicase DDX18/HAS1